MCCKKLAILIFEIPCGLVLFLCVAVFLFVQGVRIFFESADLERLSSFKLGRMTPIGS